MPVLKFRDHQAASDALVRSPLPLTERLREIYALSRRLWPTVTEPGVRKFRSIEDAQRERDELRRTEGHKEEARKDPKRGSDPKRGVGMNFSV